MSGSFTAEDFARAEFAKHENGRKAMRIDSDRGIFRWWVGRYGGATDEGMAAGGWVPVVESRITLDALEAAWESAEQADECRKGDVLISWIAGGEFRVYPAATDGPLMFSRILSRAPKREPWADLADVLRAWDAEPADADADGMAKWFHERGVRVTGGGDDE